MYGSVQKFILKSNKKIYKLDFVKYTLDCFRILNINKDDFNIDEE